MRFLIFRRKEIMKVPYFHKCIQSQLRPFSVERVINDKDNYVSHTFIQRKGGKKCGRKIYGRK